MSETMSEQQPISEGNDLQVSNHTHLLAIGLERLDRFTDQLNGFERVLDRIAEVGDETTVRQTDLLKTRIRAVTPSITMIGQVKSGKTTLTNAMTGHPDLLPTDVNPWTSVVTSLHINAELPDDAPVASFSFFNPDEWDKLVSTGGRLGELAQRSGADEELEKVREQIATMREQTRERLGRNFELLLGQSHDYGYLNNDLVQRYVCLGDNFDDDEKDENADPNQQGRFADITKSADLFFDQPEIPMPICIRDTPGVNDTFMMREQITINSLRDSHICVVVLSAHQALTTMDMALIRLISNVRSRDVIIFVNRIDELADPAQQVPEIRASILQTLKDHNGPPDPQVVFGSAYWANIAMTTKGLENLVNDSAEAMLNWAEVALEGRGEPNPAEMVWRLSGVPELFDAISERIIEGVGRDKLTHAAKQAMNIVRGLQASSNVVQLRLDGNTDIALNKTDLASQLDRIGPDTQTDLDEKLGVIMSNFADRIDRSNVQFLDRAIESLMQHLEKHGHDEVWQYNPNGLRMLLRSSYQVLNRKYNTICSEVFSEAAAALEQAYKNAFNVPVDGFTIEIPNVPPFPAPVSLGQTIALDLQSTWWRRWWKRKRSYRAFTGDFYNLIKAEVDPIINEMKGEQMDLIHEAARKVLHDFVTEQRNILLDVTEKADVSAGDLDSLFGVKAQKERDKILRDIFSELEVLAKLGFDS